MRVTAIPHEKRYFLACTGKQETKACCQSFRGMWCLRNYSYSLNMSKFQTSPFLVGYRKREAFYCLLEIFYCMVQQINGLLFADTKKAKEQLASEEIEICSACQENQEKVAQDDVSVAEVVYIMLEGMTETLHG